MLGYQKSALPPAGYPAMCGTRGRFLRPKKGHLRFLFSPIRLARQLHVGSRGSLKPLAQWLVLAADDFWYSSMRKPPKTAAARVQPQPSGKR